MSITSEANRMAALATDGVETEFDFTLLIHAESELQVWYKVTGGDYSQLTLNSHYTIEFNSSGGTVTTTGDDSPYATGEILLIRHLPITQLVNWLYNNTHSEQAHQDDFDRAVMRDLQIQEELDRSPKFETTSDTTDITFPEPEAGKSIRWNSAGDDLINASPDAPSLHGDDHLAGGADPLEIRAQDGAAVKPTSEEDGYISVYKDGATARFYTFVDGIRYYVALTADAETVPITGNPIGPWLFWGTYS